MKVELKNIERDALDKLSKKVMVEYLWLDGNKTPQIRSKTKIISVNRKNQIEIPDEVRHSLQNFLKEQKKEQEKK